MTATGVILAGGASRRMGRDKLGLAVGNRTLVHRVYGVLQSRCEEVLVAGSGTQSLPDALSGEKVRFIPDLRPGRAGPLAGIETGLTAARNDRVFVAAGDMPFIPRDLVGFLLGLVDGDETMAATPVYDGRVHPLCAAYRRGVLAELSSALDDGVRAVHVFLDSLDGVRYVDEELPGFGDPEVFLMNVNSAEDLALARRISEAGRP